MCPHQSRRRGAHQRRHQSDATFKVQIWKWISIRHGAYGDTFTVRWTVAGQRKRRPFRSFQLARSFQRMLTVAANEGQPFDVHSGMPLSLIAKRPHKTRRRRRHETPEGASE